MPIQLTYKPIRYLLMLFFTFVSLFGTARTTMHDAVEPDLQHIRKLLITSLDSRQTTDSLYSSLASIKSPTPLITAYLGALEAVKAKHAWNPYFKLKYLNASERKLATAVAGDPHNIEIRFMRFSIEHNVPGFLGYDKNLVADRQEMIRQVNHKNYSATDKTFIKTVIQFLLDSKRCTTAEQQQLRQQLAAL